MVEGIFSGEGQQGIWKDRGPASLIEVKQQLLQGLSCVIAGNLSGFFCAHITH